VHGVVPAVLLMVGAVCGCGETYKTAPVSGTVTMNGKPVAGLMIQFEPEDGGTTKIPPSIGYTNAEGKYVLIRPGGGQPGAVVGRHTVRVMTGEGTDLTAVEGRKATNAVSQRDVAPGPNVIDVDLVSQGPSPGGR